MQLRYLVLTGALYLLAGNAQGQDSFFPDNVTINFAVAANAYVGLDALPPTALTSPTVSLVDGGSIGGSLQVLNSSTFNMIDGSIGVNASGGSIGGQLDT